MSNKITEMFPPYPSPFKASDGVEFVPVVRCKECRFYLKSVEKCVLIDTRLHFYETDKIWTRDCFCCWGERREDD